MKNNKELIISQRDTHNLYNINKDLPEIPETPSSLSQRLPDLNKKLPEINKDLPQIPSDENLSLPPGDIVKKSTELPSNNEIPVIKLNGYLITEEEFNDEVNFEEENKGGMVLDLDQPFDDLFFRLPSDYYNKKSEESQDETQQSFNSEEELKNEEVKDEINSDEEKLKNEEVKDEINSDEEELKNEEVKDEIDSDEKELKNEEVESSNTSSKVEVDSKTSEEDQSKTELILDFLTNFF